MKDNGKIPVANIHAMHPRMFSHRGLGFLGVFLITSGGVLTHDLSSTARASERIVVDRLVIDSGPQHGLEYKYHWAGGRDDNYCFEGGANCAIVIFDDDPVTPEDEGEVVGYVFAP